jgi:hypothetical protein
MTSIPEKVVPYIITGSKEDEEVDGHKFQIWNSKEESSFYMFRDPESVPRRLCLAAINDKILRTFFFFNMFTDLTLLKDYPLSVKYPIILHCDEHLKSILSQDSTKKRLDGFEKDRKTIIDKLNDLSQSSLMEIIKTLTSDPGFSKSIRGGRPLKDQLFDRIFTRNRDKFEKTISEFTKIYSELTLLSKYFIPLLDAVKQFDKAELNFSRLQFATGQGDLPHVFSDALGKLARIIHMSIDGICLECVFAAGLPFPYRVVKEHPGWVVLETECPTCGSKAILYTIELKCNPKIAPLFERNLIQELIIGYCLSRLDLFEKIYIHKKVQYLKDGKTLESRQIDVFAKTNDGRIVLVEVTTQSDMNNIVKDFTRKIERLKESQIPYDLLIYQTGATQSDQYLPLSDKCYIFTANHIPKIEEQIEHLLKKQ